MRSSPARAMLPICNCHLTRQPACIPASLSCLIGCSNNCHALIITVASVFLGSVTAARAVLFQEVWRIVPDAAESATPSSSLDDLTTQKVGEVPLYRGLRCIYRQDECLSMQINLIFPCLYMYSLQRDVRSSTSTSNFSAFLDRVAYILTPPSLTPDCGTKG